MVLGSGLVFLFIKVVYFYFLAKQAKITCFLSILSLNRYMEFKWIVSLWWPTYVDSMLMPLFGEKDEVEEGNTGEIVILIWVSSRLSSRLQV